MPLLLPARLQIGSCTPLLLVASEGLCAGDATAVSRLCANKVGPAAGAAGDALGGWVTSSEGGAGEDGQQAVRAGQKRQTVWRRAVRVLSCGCRLSRRAGGVYLVICVRCVRAAMEPVCCGEPELGSALRFVVVSHGHPRVCFRAAYARVLSGNPCFDLLKA